MCTIDRGMDIAREPPPSRRAILAERQESGPEMLQSHFAEHRKPCLEQGMVHLPHARAQRIRAAQLRGELEAIAKQDAAVLRVAQGGAGYAMRRRDAPVARAPQPPSLLAVQGPRQAGEQHKGQQLPPEIAETADEGVVGQYGPARRDLHSALQDGRNHGPWLEFKHRGVLEQMHIRWQ